MKYFYTFLLLIAASLSISAQSAVTITDSVDNYTMQNGLVEAVISKNSGGIVSFKYLGSELIMLRENGVGAQWSHDTKSPEVIQKITIDPAKNGGARGEVSVKGISGGRPMGDGPGGAFIADIEIRYTLEKDSPGLYTYCVFDHLPEYPASSMGEARFVAFLEKNFDWMSIDQKRSKLYRLKDGEMDLGKYQYTSNLYENPAFGWINTTTNTGFWLINASMEYMSGGPTKVDFLAHRDTRINGAPVFLNYWRSSHYGGSSVEVAAGEKWAKLIGPIFLYANKGSDIAAIKREALARQLVEKDKFPYAWVNDVEFPLAAQRGTATGKLVLKDPLTPKKFGLLRVGLTAPDYPITFKVIPVAPAPPLRPGDPVKTEPRIVDWQFDAKNYQFWTVGNEKGEFEIKNIRPGKYTLHAIADGVLGEYVKTDITVESGKKLDLGSLTWTPVRRGKQIWEIGVSNRTGAEFLGGDVYYEDEVLKRYPKLFSTDVNYTVGKSDYRKGWYYVQIPHVDNPDAPENNRMPPRPTPAPDAAPTPVAPPRAQTPESKAFVETMEKMALTGRNAVGHETTWKINFTLDDKQLAEMRTAGVLRLAICGTGTREITAGLNGKSAGAISNLRVDGTPNRSGNHGLWYERELAIDRALFQKGDNTLTLTIPGGNVVAGIMYDYLRLEAL